MYKEEELVRIAKRENNNKRKYLVVNRLQGKHIPVSPGEAFSMFRQLADTLKSEYKQERLLLVGFAETATAIGAFIAVELKTNYIQTTREIIPDVEYIFFSEEHSHATEQKLVKDDLDFIIGNVDRIIFIEDEVTTGKTILNIIQRLEQLYLGKVKYSVASLLNGMNEDALKLYEERGIRLHYLVKTNHDQYSDIADRAVTDGVYVPCNEENDVLIQEIAVESKLNARRLIEADKYREACENLWLKINSVLHDKLSGKVLVVGTEEFMYPALFVANCIEQSGVEVACHSTTRSPISVSSDEEYPLHTRYELKSLYDKTRTTYIYDIHIYDTVLIITDAYNDEREGINSLVNAIRTKNENVFCIRWY